MQNLSYEDKNPVFNFKEWKLKFDIYTFENAYTLHAETVTVKEYENKMVIADRKLYYAGGQRSVGGVFEAELSKERNQIRVSVACSMGKTIRAVKVSVLELPPMPIINLREGVKDIPQEGCIYTYPSGWRGLYTPVVILDGRESYYYARSEDVEVREKRFAFLLEENGMTLELIHEEAGARMGESVEVPAWEIGKSQDLFSIYEKQKRDIQNRFSLQRWEERRDVPCWMKKISLVAAIHMQHWSGYTFHTYADVIEKAKWLAKRINPEQVLLYLPGWDGRYYWKYGHYTPDDSLGGISGFQEMMKELHHLGFHVMLMVGINMVSRSTENFEQWGIPSQSVNVSGIPQYTLVDWDGSRHYMHGFNTMLSIGAPPWKNRLLNEVRHLYNEYKFDAMFFDITAAWTNEQLYDNYRGLVTFVAELKKNLPDEVLIAGEGWYDGLSAVTPLVQSGHTDGVLHWHDEPFASLFDEYSRCFGHLCLGDPWRGSTGVHELGYNAIQAVPDRKGIIPTITIVNGTLENAPEKVEAIILSAQEYTKKYLNI